LSSLWTPVYFIIIIDIHRQLYQKIMIISMRKYDKISGDFLIDNSQNE